LDSLDRPLGQIGIQKQTEPLDGTLQLSNRATPVDAAKFEQMLKQASEEGFVIEAANPASSVASPSIDRVLSGINSSSKDYLGAVDNGLKALSTLDLSDPESVKNLFHHFTLATVQSVQLSVVLGEVSNSKKSVQELFHNQG
jgi:hypothetical protein